MHTSGLKQDYAGQTYMPVRDPVTREIKNIFVKLETARQPFDLRPSFGHLWVYQAGEYVAQQCSAKGCSVCQ